MRIWSILEQNLLILMPWEFYVLSRSNQNHKKPNRILSEQRKEKDMVTRNVKRNKKNNNLGDRKRMHLLKDPDVTKPSRSKQTGRKVKEDIRTLKQQMEFILGATKTGLDIIDSKFNIRYVDPEWAKVYGVPKGKKCYQYFMDRSEVCPDCGIPIALKTKAIAVTEETLVKEGHRPIQVTTIPFRNSKGEWLVAEVNVDISERKRTEEALRTAHEQLEIRVRERTAELALANEAMQLEIIERKQAEEALRQSEERYRTILENIEDGYYEVDLSGDFTFFNDSLCRMLGYSREEMVGMGNHQYTDQENRKKLFQAFNEVYRTGEPAKGFDWEVIRKDGAKVFGEVSVSLIKDLKGQPIGFRGIARDITERKQAEEALRSEKRRFQTLSDQAPFGMVMIDQEGFFKYMNPKFRELFGYDLTEIPDGKTWFRKAYPNPPYRHDVIETWINDLKSTKSGEKRSRIFAVTCKDGTKKTIHFIPVQLETGENLIACEDITERKHAEEALRESQQLLKKTFVSLRDAVFIIDAETVQILDCNPAASEMFGYTRDEIVGQPTLFLHVDSEALQEFRTYMYASVEERGFLYLPEFRMKRKNGESFSTEHNVAPLEDDQGKRIGWVSVVRDITERKRAEKKMADLQEQLRQAQRMEAVGQLAGGIAHDFNNLLTVIKGYSQLSLLDLKESNPLWGNIQEIQKATQRAADLTRQLLAFSRRQILDLKVLDLNALLKDLDKMLRRIIGEDIELVTLLAVDLGKAKIDPGQFEQMVLNLAVNARDAMPSGGKLTIETANAELDEEYAHIHIGVIPGHYVKLSISDTGTGMPQEVKDKAFEPFFTTKEIGRGTGLGLSTVYGIVKQSGGNIWVYSEPGCGTTFKIYLPRVEEELDTLSIRDETGELFKGQETVLLVEDEPSVRAMVYRLLCQQGYTVLEAANGEEALRVAREHGGDKIHLLLTDVVMPQMGGKELADQLKLLTPEIKILYTSGYTDNAIVHHGVLDPGTHFLQKPFSPKMLSRKVREVLDRSLRDAQFRVRSQ
jgi:two-component system cell cycle sensor histidine kinase/response regulator CckA